jgi:carbon-monoxide dehydrogenase small subunit
MTAIELTVNGRLVRADIAPRTHLADFLREHVLLTGTHIGCEHGICGACTVEINGEIARSCITYAVACDGAEVRTIEGFDDDPLMTRLREAFAQEHALQCGYCTPGMLIAARDLVRRRGALSRPEIRTEMSGNLCRCTGYVGIVNAIERVSSDSRPVASQPPRTEAPWLGPMPGPAARSATLPAKADANGVAQASSAALDRRQPAPASRRIDVAVGAFEQVDGAVQLTQSFVLDHPRDAVWKLMSDLEAVARCMPGAVLDGPPRDNQVKGRLSVKLGPVAASFAGQGTLRQLPAEYRQVIEGEGGDRKSGSRVSGSVDYRLSAVAGSAGQETTRVDVAMRYALTGWLAQLGRSALARDLARRIGEAFAQNIDAELRHPGGAMPPPAPLHGLALMVQIVAERLRALLAKVLGR